MDSNTSDTGVAHAAIEAIEARLARQNQELAEAGMRLAALGSASLAVPRAALEAIDEACLVRTSTLTHAAIRG